MIRWFLLALLLLPVTAHADPLQETCWPQDAFATLNSVNFAPSTTGYFTDGYRQYTIDIYGIQGTYTVNVESQLPLAPTFGTRGSYTNVDGNQELNLQGPVGFIRFNMTACGSSCIVKVRVCGLP